jgi:hypothetical protein
LADTDKPQFHPIKFIYIIDILENFSMYVFGRMKSLAFPHLPPEKLNHLKISDIVGANIPEIA